VPAAEEHRRAIRRCRVGACLDFEQCPVQVAGNRDGGPPENRSVPFTGGFPMGALDKIGFAKALCPAPSGYDFTQLKPGEVTFENDASGELIRMTLEGQLPGGRSGRVVWLAEDRSVTGGFARPNEMVQDVAFTKAELDEISDAVQRAMQSPETDSELAPVYLDVLYILRAAPGCTP
jgi:hypothetical protein